ncbi:hypothetical protein Patl1_30198 [Pistacia atlantica]|uniref:Uncharacterized protein n=1 Tax=Pistacia atlantica TaxID=434234 RepID=A0ACC1A8W6_9ROSI|nr:hypothetical protein Patl1_30198 [Pistacia atlantica]
MNIDSQFSVDLSSYEAACTLDLGLQSFDNIMSNSTSRVISSLSTGVKVCSLSFDSLKEVTGSLLDMNQEVAKVILECKKDIWNNQELFDLVEEYFESSIQIFEEEMGLQDGVNEKRYVKTLEELKKFKETGNPSTKEFFTLFQLVYKQQLSMLQKFQRRKLDKKLKSMKTWRMVSNVLFVSVFGLSPCEGEMVLLTIVICKHLQVVVDLEVSAANKDQLLVGLLEELEIDLAVFFEQ